jgi:tRNA G18 (ribose-2'-O)-methylase SpoU
MGSEREGLTASQSAICDELVGIPMQGRVTSLNLAIATGVMLYSMADKKLPL